MNADLTRDTISEIKKFQFSLTGNETLFYKYVDNFMIWTKEKSMNSLNN